MAGKAAESFGPQRSGEIGMNDVSRGYETDVRVNPFELLAQFDRHPLDTGDPLS
jgi:hypothetical protein